MSAHSTQNYYLINLSTRNVSISTHLRSDNYTLKSGKCIYLGNLTDELIIKYNKYSALNINLRIVTKDKLESILNKSINLNNEQIKSILKDSDYKPIQKQTNTGLSETSFLNIEEHIVTTNTNGSDNKTAVSYTDKPLAKSTSVLKHNDETVNVNNDSEKTDVVSENKSEIVELESEQKKEDNKQDYYDFSNNVSEYTVKEINVVEESIKEDVKNMSYNQLYELVKQRNLLSGGKGRPSRAKLIELLSSDV